jgi:hypothetical protein
VRLAFGTGHGRSDLRPLGLARYGPAACFRRAMD